MVWRQEDPGDVVTYESEVLETIQPNSETINQTSSQPIGFVDVQSAHIGYKARLWKIVTENGVEVSREQINSSSYIWFPVRLPKGCHKRQQRL